ASGCCPACNIERAANQDNKSCCACPGKRPAAAPHKSAPSKCVCHDQVANFEKGVRIDAPPIALAAGASVHALPVVLAACSYVCEILAQDDYQSRLCRWLI